LNSDSAGGDWLAEESADPQKLSSTMLRYARAMQIAANPSEERREYAKKLYKLVAPEGDSQLALFSQFAAGTIDKDQLKNSGLKRPLAQNAKQISVGNYITVPLVNQFLDKNTMATPKKKPEPEPKEKSVPVHLIEILMPPTNYAT
jgi:hypothetical protein